MIKSNYPLFNRSKHAVVTSQKSFAVAAAAAAAAAAAPAGRSVRSCSRAQRSCAMQINLVGTPRAVIRHERKLFAPVATYRGLCPSRFPRVYGNAGDFRRHRYSTSGKVSQLQVGKRAAHLKPILTNLSPVLARASPANHPCLPKPRRPLAPTKTTPQDPLDERKGLTRLLFPLMPQSTHGDHLFLLSFLGPSHRVTVCVQLTPMLSSLSIASSHFTLSLLCQKILVSLYCRSASPQAQSLRMSCPTGHIDLYSSE